ncbi:MAG: hypothetical protein F6K37_33980 [Moorea sp. SIO4E2]|uniref:hypothetical protein n=1 Tax=Moorena sp. SIO4E2 TaxID=2607826 RepID=UPI0013BDE622|nr:hypothetical protein [Moorena sp. SIO4E2]NEQ10751.1 hypothetical protein [Moorena sp. SIO4E2]
MSRYARSFWCHDQSALVFRIYLKKLYSVFRTNELYSILFSLLPTPYSLLPTPFAI